MNYLDLFSGIGGFSLGFQRAGYKFDKHYFSEIDIHATKIYKKHFPDSIELGNIKSVKGGELGKVDLLTFGFPCQDLSVAGKRAGLGGSRSGLFFEATRIIRECHPVTFIFENVAGLLTSNDGQDFEVVLREIADIGLYECEWQLLNTSWFLPQNRERVYFIGHLAERGGCKVFPIGEGSQEIDGVQRQTGCEWQGIQSGVSDREGNKISVEGRGGQVNDLVMIAPNGKEIDLSKMPSEPFQLLEVRTEIGKESRKKIRKTTGKDSTKRGKNDKKYIPKFDGLANCLTTGTNDIEKLLICPR